MRRTRHQHGNVQRERRSNGPDAWIYRWREYLPDGRVRRRGETIGTVKQYPTKAKALKACGELYMRANSGGCIAPTVAFGAVLDRYLAEELPERHSTQLAYRSYIGKHIRPQWDDRPLTDFAQRGFAFKVEEWLKTLALAPKTKGNIRNTMTVIINCARRWGLLDGENPMRLVRVKGISRRQKEPRVLAPLEIQQLIAELEEPYRTMVIMAISTGLRCSELFALRWLDFDWKQLTVVVRRAIVNGKVGEVKTKYSRSGLPLDAALAETLFHWQRVSQFARPEDWVFASPYKAGELPFRSTAILTDRIKPAVKRAGLGSGIGWHTFRHTYSTILRQLGVDLKVQQELLRHADIRTTMNIYTQAVSDDKRAAHSKVVRMVLPEVDSFGQERFATR